MEAIAFVEELGRNGDVVRRHCIKQLPIHIGRSYDSDVILDDPHVAAKHLEIRLDEKGGLKAVDLGSLNGTHRLGEAARISTTQIHGDDVFRIGQTQLRIRMLEQTVPSELPLQQWNWDRNPWVFVGSVVLLICNTAWSHYVTTYSTDTYDIFLSTIDIFLILLVWSSVWSLVCRTLHGSGNFMAHGIVAFLGFSILSFVEVLTGYVNIAFDLHGLDLVWMFFAAAVIASMLYRHLRLTVRLSPRILTALAVFLSAIFYGGIEGLSFVRDADKHGLQSFDQTIKPSAFIFARGIAPDQFADIAEQLKTKADKDAGSMTH